MRKTIKYFMALVLVITLFANTSGIAQADDGQKSKDGQIGIWTRVAQAFNTTVENVRNVFMQARGENREEMTSGKLDALVTAGKITPEQDTEYKAWLALRPDGPFVDQNRMENLLKEGQISQEQFDTWKVWNATKPDIQLPKPSVPGKDATGPQGNKLRPPLSENMTAKQPPTGENRQAITPEKLDALVTAGKITLEQATELKAWIAQKPDGPFVDKNTMEKLLKEGKITQEQVDARVAWREARPDVQLPKPIKPGGNIQLPKPGKPGGNRR